MLRHLAQVFACCVGPALMLGSTVPISASGDEPHASVYAVGANEPAGLLDIDAVALRVYSADLSTPTWVKDSGTGSGTHTRWYYNICYQVNVQGGGWGQWNCSYHDIPPADWAGCQKILVVLHNIQPGDLVKFGVTRMAATWPYRYVTDCSDGTTMTQAYNGDYQQSGALGPGDAFDSYFYYYAQ